MRPPRARRPSVRHRANAPRHAAPLRNGVPRAGRIDGRAARPAPGGSDVSTCLRRWQPARPHLRPGLDARATGSHRAGELGRAAAVRCERPPPLRPRGGQPREARLPTPSRLLQRADVQPHAPAPGARQPLPTHGVVLRRAAPEERIHLPGPLHRPQPVRGARNILDAVLHRAGARRVVPERRHVQRRGGARRDGSGGGRRVPVRMRGEQDRHRCTLRQGRQPQRRIVHAVPTSSWRTPTCRMSTGSSCRRMG